MITQCIIFNTKGDVLFSWGGADGKLEIPVVNSFILDILINDSAEMDGSYATANETLKYIKNGSVIYCVSYPKLVTLKGVEDLLSKVKLAFDNGVEVVPILKAFESKHVQKESEKVEVLETVVEPVKKGKGNKKGRKWGEDGLFYDNDGDEDESKLDFSGNASSSGANTKSANVEQLVGSTKDYGSKTKDGKFIISDFNETVELESEATSGIVGGFKKIWSQYVGGGEITPEEFKKIRGKIIEHLVKRNVSNSVCEGLMDEIEKAILGQNRATFTSLESVIKDEMAIKLRKLLTPKTSINLLGEIESKKDPYVISVVGVNGVGKSTNLSKLAYWLLQNNFKVLIAACDTFRSGAVEQLRVHVNNLSGLSEQKIELFELGYGGKDLVSKIARGAIQHAKDNEFDVILMDTAGRRHNDTQLMAPLASFAKVANPDKIIMVGEALVGSDAVMQAKNFNGAFGKGRGLDAFIVSKCDTVGDQLGSIVDLVYATKVPVLFVGIGQTYTDLRVLSVEWVINQLLS